MFLCLSDVVGSQLTSDRNGESSPKCTNPWLWDPTTVSGDVTLGIDMGGFFFVEIYRVITTALWSRGGSAVVSVHPPAARLCGFSSRR